MSAVRVAYRCTSYISSFGLTARRLLRRTTFASLSTIHSHPFVLAAAILPHSPSWIALPLSNSVALYRFVKCGVRLSPLNTSSCSFLSRRCQSRRDWLRARHSHFALATHSVQPPALTLTPPSPSRCQLQRGNDQQSESSMPSRHDSASTLGLCLPARSMRFWTTVL